MCLHDFKCCTAFQSITNLLCSTILLYTHIFLSFFLNTLHLLRRRGTTSTVTSVWVSQSVVGCVASESGVVVGPWRVFVYIGESTVWGQRGQMGLVDWSMGMVFFVSCFLWHTSHSCSMDDPTDSTNPGRWCPGHNTSGKGSRTGQWGGSWSWPMDLCGRIRTQQCNQWVWSVCCSCVVSVSQ